MSHLKYMKKDLEEEKAWNILHALQCDLENVLYELAGKSFQWPKHAVDIILKRSVCEIQRAKDKILEEHPVGD